MKITFILLAFSIFHSSNVLANNPVCEVAASNRKVENLKDVFGDKTWEIQTTASEVVYKYGIAKKRAVRLKPEVQLLLNAIVGGNLSEAQLVNIENYKTMLLDMQKSSILVGRIKMDESRNEPVVAQSLSEALESAEITYEQEASAISRFFSKLNPVNYFSAARKQRKKFGPPVAFISANQMGDIITNYPEADRLAAFKYLMAPVEMLSPKEVLTLLGKMPKEIQVDTFNFLADKIIGRFDFFSNTELIEASKYLTPVVLLKVISHSGSRWPVADLFGILKDAMGLLPNEIAEALAKDFNAQEWQKFFDSKTQLDLKEAQILLFIFLKNSHGESESAQIYTELANKLYHSTDKQDFQKIYTKGLSGKSTPIVRESLDIDDLAFEALKKKASTESGIIFSPPKEKKQMYAQIYRIMQYRIESGKVQTLDEFLKNLELPKDEETYIYLRTEIDGRWSRFKKEFISLNPNLKQYWSFYSNIHNWLEKVEFANFRLDSTSVKSAGDFLETINIPKEYQSGPEVRNAFSYILHRRAKQFIQMQPTLEEFDLAKRLTTSVTDMIALMEARLIYGNLTDPKVIEETFAINSSLPSENLLKSVLEFKQKYYEGRLDLTPR